MVQPVLQRVIYILKKQGRIEMPTVNGREVKIRSVSPLAQAQSNQDIVSLNRFLQTVGNTFGPEMLNVLISSEETAVYLAKKFGIPDSLIRDLDERQEIVRMAQQMQQQQQMIPPQEGEQPDATALGVDGYPRSKEIDERISKDVESLFKTPKWSRGFKVFEVYYCRCSKWTKYFRCRTSAFGRATIYCCFNS